MEAIAKTKYLKGSPRKARLVIDLVRGKNVSHALAILKFTNKRAADPIEKCIRSAIANATYKAEKENIAIDPDDLWIKTCFVDMGPTKNRRRLRPAPQGRAYFERRHYCHITVEVTSEAPEEVEEFVPKPRPKKKAPEKPKAEAKAEEAKPAAVEETETEEVPEAAAAEEPAATEEAKAADAEAPETAEAEAAEDEAKGEEVKAEAVEAEEKAADEGEGSDSEDAEAGAGEEE